VTSCDEQSSEIKAMSIVVGGQVFVELKDHKLSTTNRDSQIKTARYALSKSRPNHDHTIQSCILTFHPFGAVLK
jgi:hypothetical protein